MDGQLLTIFMLTFLIHLIGTLAYSVRIAGTRTGRIAVSFALFNLLVLVSRTSNSFQTPLLAKRVEEGLLSGSTAGAELDFRWLILAASFATLIGALLIPTFQRLFSKAVEGFNVHRSVLRLFVRGLSPAGLAQLRGSIRMPVIENVTRATSGERIPVRVVAFNTIATAIWTVGIFSSLYAGYLHPELRATASQLSGVINGAATILMFAFIDPHLSVLTDDVVRGRASEPFFRKSVVWLVGGRLAGTLMAQVLLIPGAMWVVFVAERL